MLTLAYCRVSTEEQAEEGFTIEGQADKLRSYSNLRDLGEVTIITDPGLSGKNLQRPGLQQLLAAVEAGHVSHVLVWRLDRLSRSLSDLILLADKFGELGVALHSVSENLDLSSASGRMFYNILGTFAQFFREQFAENVKMGNERAVKEGRWINRPKTGYDLIDGELIPNVDAGRVQEIFTLRGQGRSYRKIEEQTAVRFSTVKSILESRIYLGDVLYCTTASGSRVTTQQSSPKGSSTRPTGGSPREFAARRTCCRVACAVGSAVGAWRSTKTARALSSTSAATAVRGATNRPGAPRDFLGRPCSDSRYSAATNDCWRPFERS
jgi:DNA invertase Pin-like site-specific DNA recombinase